MYEDVHTDLSEPLELYLQLPGYDDKVFLKLCFLANGQTESVIQKDMNTLTQAEGLQNEAACRKAMLDEVRRWHSLKSSSVFPRGCQTSG